MSESREQFFNVLFSLAENHKGGVPDVSTNTNLEQFNNFISMCIIIAAP